jgi:2-polyprenyl-6-methoxyphenol hydroxylase-like FAD-dependent oxidoreductase
VHDILWQSDFTVSVRQAEAYQVGRVFLVGDAAHIHSPLGARGMNLGIEDATLLARRIVNGGLDRYSAAGSYPEIF